ncbi:MAG: hypothetical protein KGJ13_01980 [Patescibacteria group bacterium]|nr:hypothetical protein [Patescibacteria group bacterium]
MDYFKPPKTTLAAGKEKFLAAFDVEFGGARSPVFRPRFFSTLAFKVLIAVIAVFGLTSGMAIYANAQNVPVDSPLYPLKRVAESVQLAFAATQARPALQEKFAARRLGEIDDLSHRNPGSNALPKLKDDLHHEMENSMNGAEQSNLSAGEFFGFCDRLRSIMGTSSVAMQDELIAHPKLLQHFDKRCVVED